MQRLSELSDLLWRERRLLELLVFKLEEQQLVLVSGRGRWLAPATDEVEAILDQIAPVDLDRAVRVQAVGGDLGLGDFPSLRNLADAVPAPWDGIFEEHLEALREAAREACAVAWASRELLGREGRDAVLEADALLGASERRLGLGLTGGARR